MGGDISGPESDYDVWQSSERGVDVTLTPVLPFFYHFERSQIHPFLRLLEVCSLNFYADRFVDLDKKANPILLPTAETWQKPFAVPENIKAAFLKTIENLGPQHLPQNPYERDTHVMTYAAHPWQDYAPYFYSFVHTLRNIEQTPRTNAQVFDCLDNLWTLFPFCDYRVEMAYQAYRSLRAGADIRDHMEPSYDFNQLSFLFTASQRNTFPQNIALRFLLDKRVEARQEDRKKIKRKLRDAFTSLTKGPDALILTPQQNLRTIIHHHKELLKNEGSHERKRSYLFQYPPSFRELSDYPKKKLGAFSDSLWEEHECIASGAFFATLYFDLYREEWERKMNSRPNVEEFPFLHPVYRTGTNKEEDEYVAEFMIFQDMYLMDNFGDFYIKDDGKLRDFCLSEAQLRLKDHLSTGLFYLMQDANDSNRVDYILRRHKSGILEPRVCALYRIFMLPYDATFEEEMGVIGFPLKIRDEKTLKRTEDLIQWFERTEGAKEAVAHLYLSAEIHSYFCNLTGTEAIKVAKIIDGLNKDELKDLEKCPEILLVALLSSNYSTVFPKGFGSLDKFPFHLFNMDDYRFGEKNIQRKDAFVKKLPRIIENYNSILSGDFSRSLRRSFDRYKESLNQSSSATPTQNVSSPKELKL